MSTILTFSCSHLPNHHPDLFSFLREVKRVYKPDRVIHLGDEADYGKMSYHESDPDLPSERDEYEAAKKAMKRLYRLFPDMDICFSNHGSMPFRKAKTAGIPASMLKSYNALWEVPATWRWVPEVRVKVNGYTIIFVHSFGANILNAARDLNSCLVQGHHHSKTSIAFFGRGTELKWAMQLGWLGNDKSSAFDYNKHHSKRPLLNCGLIIDGEPLIVPMRLNRSGRWVGHL